MDKIAYIDAMARASMITGFAIADANEGNPYQKEPVTKRGLEIRLAQLEGYITEARAALIAESDGNIRVLKREVIARENARNQTQ